MPGYKAPLSDMQFLLHEVFDLTILEHAYDSDLINPELWDSVLEECAKFTESVLSPLNKIGDKVGAQLKEGVTITPPGFKEAYQQFIESGWNGLIAPQEHGGQGLPVMLSAVTEEMWHSANMSFTLCPLLTRGAVESIEYAASEKIKNLFLTKMVEGRWTGTMNLTEPQAGSDLSAIKTKAIREGDHYKIYGQKIFITYGDHDLTDNIIHLVLARLPDAPPGIKGISLFLVPKIMVNEDGSLAEPNDVKTVSIEHKLGIHASPTCVLSYGDQNGAIGYLIGEENKGIEIMFVMMNAARFSVGVQGYAIGEMAFQAAKTYSLERKQGIPFGSKQPLPIVSHPDVAQSLLGMKSRLNACRHLSLYAALNLDLCRSTDVDQSAKAKRYADLLTPIVKGFCTEVGNQICYESIQIFGGMGFIEEAGVAQYFRDARITTIYEGTTGIQANDLLGRKILRDEGETFFHLIDEIKETINDSKSHSSLLSLTESMNNALSFIIQTQHFLTINNNQYNRYSHAKDFLMMMGWFICGWLTLKEALVCHQKMIQDNQASTYLQRLKICEYFILQYVPQCQMYALMIEKNSVLQSPEDITEILN